MYKGEINLLPALLQKKRLRRAYLKSINRLFNRLVILLSLVVFAQAGIYFVVRTVNNSLIESQKTAVEEGVGVFDEVTAVNTFMHGFEDRLQRFTLWTPFITDVLTVVTPTSVTLQGLSSADDGAVLVVEGITSRRSDMLLFQKKLGELSWVEKIDAPLSNFTVGAKATFKFNIHIRNESL